MEKYSDYIAPKQKPEARVRWWQYGLLILIFLVMALLFFFAYFTDPGVG